MVGDLIQHFRNPISASNKAFERRHPRVFTDVLPVRPVTLPMGCGAQVEELIE